MNFEFAALLEDFVTWKDGGDSLNYEVYQTFSEEFSRALQGVILQHADEINTSLRKVVESK